MNHNHAIVLVGHSHWGKSRTLKSLADGSIHKSWISIKGLEIFMKRMSNDDIPESLIHFLKKINPATKQIILITLCPDFKNSFKETQKILDLLSDKYKNIFFWVLKNKYGSDSEIGEGEIQTLRNFGSVGVFAGQAEANVRALELKNYIESIL